MEVVCNYSMELLCPLQKLKIQNQKIRAKNLQIYIIFKIW